MIHLGPFMINWHGILTAVGILAGWYAAGRLARRFGINPEEISRLAPYLIVSAIIGGRVAYVLSHLDDFTGNLWAVVRIDQGGLASHGALLFGFLTVYAYARRRGQNLGHLLDALAPAIPINYLAMRIGNFLIGELYGDPTSLPWGVVFPGAGASPRHPAQLYDGVGQTIVLILLLVLARRPRPAGEFFWLTLAGTSVVRLFSDLVRTQLRVIGPLTLGQVGAVVALLIALGALWSGRRRWRRTGEAEGSSLPPPATAQAGQVSG
ncbi:MAG: prolipoprotein diacylglyceryl transferase [bacterium]